MIKIENTEVVGWEAAIRGMRNPHNSWSKSDSSVCAYSRHVPHCKDCEYVDSCNPEEDMYKKYIVGPNDHDLMIRLAKGGSVHAKYRRMIVVYADITAPLYWWKEFDTYKVGTVANSCSTMHKIHEKEFTLEDFSCEHLFEISTALKEDIAINEYPYLRKLTPIEVLNDTISMLNVCREKYLAARETEDETGLLAKDIWWQMIQLLPSSYNQRRTVMLNYEVLAGIYPMRKDHKLDEWRVHETPIEHRDRNKDFSSGMWGFCDWIESLPYSEIITAKPEEKKSNLDKSDIAGTLKTAVEMLHLHGYNLLGDEITKIEKLFNESEG